MDDAGSDETRDKFVYLHLDGRGRPRYVGKGSEYRALSHPGGTHNAGLREWLDGTKDYEVRIAGPITERESLLVESALISALGAQEGDLFNDHPGSSLRFRPPGVPAAKADRLRHEPIQPSEVATQVGGALFVYAPSAPMQSPTQSELATAVDRAWRLSHLYKKWRSLPELIPKAVIGITGPLGRRFANASFEIEEGALSDPDSLRLGNLWRIPLRDPANPDFGDLQGRRIDIKFGRGKHEHFRWYDAEGNLHPYGT